MKKSIFSLTAVATPILLSCAMLLEADTTYIQGGIGYRQDSITLNIKERGSINPRAKSNRHFKDIEIVVLGGKIKSTLGSCDAYIRGSFDYGFVLDGKLRDGLLVEDRNELTEFHHCGYTTEGEFLSSTVHNSIKNSSFVWDLDLALAYPIDCGCDGVQFAPAIGFSLDRQQLRVKGTAALTDVDFSDSDIDTFGLSKTHGRRSSYRGSWWGPWLGFDFAYNSPDCWNVYGAFEFHVGRARRQVNSHTERKYIDHYSRTKTFYGPLFKLGTAYMFCENWYADANITYWKYFSNTNRDHVAWSSASIRLDLGYVF